MDVPLLARYAVNAQRALDQLAQRCASQAHCRKAFPHWERQLGELVNAWNARPVHGMTGDQLASVVHEILRNVKKAVSIPIVVSRAAKGDYAPLEQTGSGDLQIGDLTVMGASIWCSEPSVGLDARGPWGTDFDSYATTHIADVRQECSSEFSLDGACDAMLADFVDLATTKGLDANILRRRSRGAAVQTERVTQSAETAGNTSVGWASVSE